MVVLFPIVAYVQTGRGVPPHSCPSFLESDLDTLHTQCLPDHCSLLTRGVFQEYFCANGGCEEDCNPSFEKFVTSVVHIAPLETKLHKGQFYIHISRTSPGQLVVKYADSGEIHAVQLQNEELVRLWSPDWADLMRKERETRFLFLHCIIRTEKGLEKRQWKYLLKEGVEEYKNIIKDIELNST